jgi:hypothetical protein
LLVSNQREYLAAWTNRSNSADFHKQRGRHPAGLEILDSYGRCGVWVLGIGGIRRMVVSTEIEVSFH